MPREMTVSDSVVLRGVPADAVYPEIADPSRMGRWSPENTGTLSGGGTGPGVALSVGDVFVGVNRRGRISWSTRCRVVAAEPGRRFAFTVFQIGYAGRG